MPENNAIGVSARNLGRPEYRLAAIYAFYFGVLGLLLPYWPLFLASKGYSGVQIGYLLALMLGTKSLSPWIWGWLADHHVNRVNLVQLGSVGALVCFAGVFWVDAFSEMFGVILLFAFFFNAVLPQLEAMTLETLGERSQCYSQVRLWGSIGFIVASLAGGMLLQGFGIERLPTLCMFMVGATVMLSLVLTNLQARNLDSSMGPKINYLQLFQKKSIWQFVLVCFFMQASFGPYNSFISIYLEQIGYSKSEIAWLWSWGVIAEVILFLCMTRIFQRFCVSHLISFSLVMGLVRWGLTPWAAHSFLAIFLVQSCHALTFALFHAACIARVHALFPRAQWGQGMAIYTLVSYGLGGALGSILSGIFWSPEQPEQVFMLAVTAVVLGLVAYQLLKPAT